MEDTAALIPTMQEQVMGWVRTAIQSAVLTLDWAALVDQRIDQRIEVKLAEERHSRDSSRASSLSQTSGDSRSSPDLHSPTAVCERVCPACRTPLGTDKSFKQHVQSALKHGSSQSPQGEGKRCGMSRWNAIGSRTSRAGTEILQGLAGACSNSRIKNSRMSPELLQYLAALEASPAEHLEPAEAPHLSSD